MPLRILHVLSSTFFAGSTAYAITLSEKQVSEGHAVFMITDTGGLSSLFPCTAQPVSNRSFLQRIKNIIFLKRFIKENKIDIVHAHSRAASWISYYAVLGKKVAYVSTIHGRQVKHSKYKKSDVFGNMIIAICPNLLLHLKNEIAFNADKLEYIPNGINSDAFVKFKQTQPHSKIVISFIGRFNGPKGENIAQLVTEIFPQLLKDFPLLNIQLTGGEWEHFPKEGKQGFDALAHTYGERIKYFGFSHNVHQSVIDSDLVIGAGRVALEALFLKVPVFAMGEACCHGILTHANIQDAMLTNFGDILPAKATYCLDNKAVQKNFNDFLNNPDLFRIDLSETIEIYNINNVFPKVMEVYKKALMRKAYGGTIPVLMYHRVPDNSIQSKHRTFVSKKRFGRHLLFYRLRGLTSITFKDYLAFCNGDKPISEFPRKPFILTFDDGYKDNFRNMLPLTKKYNFKGVMFLLGDNSLSKNNWDNIEKEPGDPLMTIQEKMEFVNAGWEIGAHTLTHCDLTQVPPEKATAEIEKSKRLLEQTFNTEIISFAYPYGRYNDLIKEMVSQSGFEYGISTDTGGIFIENDPYAVFRVNMFPEESLFQLYKKTSGWYRKYYYRKRGK